MGSSEVNSAISDVSTIKTVNNSVANLGARNTCPVSTSEFTFYKRKHKQCLVYVEVIPVLFLFVVMMLNLTDFPQIIPNTLKYNPYKMVCFSIATISNLKKL